MCLVLPKQTNPGEHWVTLHDHKKQNHSVRSSVSLGNVYQMGVVHESVTEVLGH